MVAREAAGMERKRVRRPRIRGGRGVKEMRDAASPPSLRSNQTLARMRGNEERTVRATLCPLPAPPPQGPPRGTGGPSLPGRESRRPPDSCGLCAATSVQGAVCVCRGAGGRRVLLWGDPTKRSVTQANKRSRIVLTAHRLHATRGQRLFAWTILLRSPVTSVSAREAGADDGR